MFIYFRMAPEGAAMIARYPRIATWLDAMLARPSVAATRSPLEYPRRQPAVEPRPNMTATRSPPE